MAYSALTASKEVKVPGPANKGNAIGKTAATFGDESSSLNKVTPSIISSAKKNKINAPATANSFTFTPIKFKIRSPTNKNITIKAVAIIEAFSD